MVAGDGPVVYPTAVYPGQEEQRVAAELERQRGQTRSNVGSPSWNVSGAKLAAESRAARRCRRRPRRCFQSCEPKSYHDGQQLLGQGSAASGEGRLADAARLFNEAADRFVQAQREAPLIGELEKLRREWTTTLGSADQALLATHASEQLALAKRQAALAEERLVAADYSAGVSQYKTALDTLLQARNQAAESAAVEDQVRQLEAALAKQDGRWQRICWPRSSSFVLGTRGCRRGKTKWLL